MTELDRRPALTAYEMAHRVLKSSPELGGKDGRRAPRYQFDVLQWIAPYDGNGLPDKSDFSPVRCRDISKTGFSFIVPERLDFPILVVSLGEPPNQMHMVAEVMYCHKVRFLGGRHIEMVDEEDDYDDENVPGNRAFLVGCRFKDRVE